MYLTYVRLLRNVGYTKCLIDNLCTFIYKMSQRELIAYETYFDGIGYCKECMCYTQRRSDNFPGTQFFLDKLLILKKGLGQGTPKQLAELKKKIWIFWRQPFSQWKQATRRKSPQWPNVAGIEFVIAVPMCMIVSHEKRVKKLSPELYSIFGAFSSSHWEKGDFIKTRAIFSVLM